MISAPRLATYVALTRSGSRQDAIELHQATMSLGVALSAVTGLIEIALRNSACHELNETFSAGTWLRPEAAASTPIDWVTHERNNIKQAQVRAQRAKYSKLSGPAKVALDSRAFPGGAPVDISHADRAKGRQRVISVDDSQVIAQLTFYFWKRLFSDHYEKTLWKRALKRVFPNKTLSRADVASRLETIYEIRNRLAHHEPVYGARLDGALEAIDFLSQNLGSRVPTVHSPFSKLIMPQKDILEGQVAIFRSTFSRLTE